MTSMYSNLISKYREKYSRDDNDNNYDTYNNNSNFNTYKYIVPRYRIIIRRRQFIIFKDEDISVSILGKKRKYDDAFI